MIKCKLLKDKDNFSFKSPISRILSTVLFVHKEGLENIYYSTLMGKN